MDVHGGLGQCVGGVHLMPLFVGIQFPSTDKNDNDNDKYDDKDKDSDKDEEIESCTSDSPMPTNPYIF